MPRKSSRYLKSVIQKTCSPVMKSEMIEETYILQKHFSFEETRRENFFKFELILHLICPNKVSGPLQNISRKTLPTLRGFGLKICNTNTNTNNTNNIKTPTTMQQHHPSFNTTTYNNNDTQHHRTTTSVV